MIPQNLLPRKFTRNLMKSNGRLRKADAFVVPLIIIFVGVGSFGLGRLSAMDEFRGTLAVQGAEPAQTQKFVSQPAAAAAAAGVAEEKFVASRSGSKYYLPTCAGAKSIKEENKIWFMTAQEAQDRGYEPAANCKGL